ncbi:hypothetical protein AAVH_18894, partial [Aphelenchoides avenae]
MKELTNYVQTEGYRMTIGKCTDAEAPIAFQAIGSGPLVFEDEAPLGLVQPACKVYLSGAESSHNIRDIVCNFRPSTRLLEDVQPADVCSEIYVSMFPCPRCSAPDTLQQVFHHVGVDGRELRYELSFSSFDDRQQYGGHVIRERVTLRTLSDIRDADSVGPIKSALVKLTVSATISKCMESKDPAASDRSLVASFTVYARDVFTYLDRYDLDRSELISFAWRRTLVETRTSMAVRCLCMELVMALDGTWVTPIIYNPGLDDLEVDRRQFKLPYRSAELDSQLIRDHLRNSFVASIVVAHEWGDDMPVTGNEATRWICGMLGGLDNCRIGELFFSQVYPNFEDISTILDRAVVSNRPQRLSMSFNSDELLRRFFTLVGFLHGGRYRDIERMEYSV